MRLSERRVELRIKRLTRTVTKTVGKSPAEPPLGINAKGVEMTRNIIQTIKIERIRQVPERCIIKPENRHSPKTLLSIRSTSVIDTQQSERWFAMF